MKKILFKILLICSVLPITAFSTGSGYEGNLPELGKSFPSTEEKPVIEAEVNKTAPKEKTLDYTDTKTFFPRIYSNYNTGKYSDYLNDMKEVELLLVNLREVIKSDKTDKVQQYTAKVHILHLHVVNLTEKYSNKPEKHYESFKKLVYLDKCLIDSVVYYRKKGKYINDQTSLKSINTVLEMIQNPN